MAKKRKSYARKEYDLEKGTLTFSFSDKSKRVIDLNSMPDAMKLQAQFHGFSQKIGDTAASVNNLDEYKSAIADEVAKLMTGDWKSPSKGVGGLLGQAVINVLTREKKEFDTAKIKKVCETPEGRKGIKANPVFLAEFQKLDAEQKAKKAAAAKAALKLAQKSADGEELSLDATVTDEKGNKTTLSFV